MRILVVVERTEGISPPEPQAYAAIVEVAA
jgi:hypothetical protein